MTEELRRPPELTVIALFRDFRRDAKQPLHTFGPDYQIGINTHRYQILAIDNGLGDRMKPEELMDYGGHFRYLYAPNASPVECINNGIAEVQTPYVMCLLDGACLLSPGVLRFALEALRAKRNALVYALDMNLNVAPLSPAADGDAAPDDDALEAAGWREDGYRLFDGAVLADNCPGGYFNPVKYSSCFAVDRQYLASAGGFDKGFPPTASDALNAEVFQRLTQQSDSQPLALLGEAVFHVSEKNDDAAAGAGESSLVWHEVYRQQRGCPYHAPVYTPQYYGHAPEAAAAFFRMKPGQGADRQSPVVAVLGMHRSGTSCLAGCLQTAGLHAGDVVEWRRDNRKGNRENPAIVELNEAVLAHNGATWDCPPSLLSWTAQHEQRRNALVDAFGLDAPAWMFKDPRTLLTLPFWQAGIEHLVPVGIFRHPLRVAMSLYRRSQMPLRHGLDLWLSYNQQLLNAYQRCQFPLMCFDSPKAELMRQLELALNRLNGDIGGAVDLGVADASEFFDDTLINEHQAFAVARQESGENQNNGDAEQVFACALQLYCELRLAAGLSIDEPRHAEREVIVPLQGTVNAYRNALLSQPSNPQIHLMLGNALQQQGKVAEALASYRLALDLDPRQIEVCVQLGKLLEAQGSIDEALGLYRQALREHPDDLRLLLPVAEVLHERKDYAAAAVVYTKIAELMPGNVQTLIKLGNALLADRRLDEAAASFTSIIELKPEDARGHFLLGNVYRDQGDANNAIRCYRQSLALAHHNPVAVRIQLGSVLVKTGQLDAARKEYEKSIESAPDNAHLQFLLGNVHRDQEAMEEAVACYRRSLDLGHQNPAAVYFQLGKVLEGAGRTGEAVEAYTQGVRIKPNAHIHYLLGNAQRILQHHKEAISCYQRAIDMHDPNPFRFHRALAEVHVEVEEIDAAITAYKKARSLQPENAQVRSALDALLEKRF